MPKAKSQIDQRVFRDFQRNRNNPIRGLTPQRLSDYLTAFDAGRVSHAALVWDKVMKRDDILTCVVPKRMRAPGQRGWDIVTPDPSPRADKQKKALEYFFQNCLATSAIDQDYRRGFSGCLEQMMGAVANRWAAHEVIWKPSRAGITAELRHIPLWFFERTEGRCRFIENPFAYGDGMELDPGGWQITAGDGIMEASSVCYVFKSMSLSDWVIWCEKFGIPYLLGTTSAPPDSDHWEALHDALKSFINDGAAVVSLEGKIEPIEVSASTLNPMQQLIERADRRLSAIWRGGDLSSMSGEDQLGATLQGEEADTLLFGDIEMLESSINFGIVPWVIRYATGDDDVLAQLRIPVPDRKDTQQEMSVDKHFVSLGVPMSVADMRERYGRPEPEEGEETVGSDGNKPGDEPESDPAPNEDPENEEDDDEDPDDKQLPNERPPIPTTPEASNREALIQESIAAAADVLPAMLSPVADLVAELTEAARDPGRTDSDVRALASAMINRLPELLGDLGTDALAQVIREALGTAWVQGVAEAELRT